MTYNVLFLCTGNSARSILGEAILNKIGKGKFTGHSAGSIPKGGSIHTLCAAGTAWLSHEGLRSKSWSEFAQPARRTWISFSPSATMPPTKSARSGLVSR